jgi:Transglycosylase SLT domain
MPILSISRPRATLASATLALASSCTHADCIADAASRHQVNAEVLRAIGWQESRLQPRALGRNANGSIDVGAFQINSVHLSELGRYGIGASALADGCVSAEVAAWHYRRQVDRDGDGWQAVGAYHSRHPVLAARYANQIAAILMRWQVMPAGGLPFPAEQAPAASRSRPPSPAVPPLEVVASPSAPAAPSGSGQAIAYREIDYHPSPR